MKDFRNQDPRDIVGRCITLQDLKTVPPELILKMDEKFHAFVTGQKETSNLLGKDGQKISKLRINWEFALFTATQALIVNLFSNLVRKKKVDEKAG